MKHAVKLVKEAPDSYVVAGYGVIWDGQDLGGQWFDKSTDLWLDRMTGDPMLMFDHGMDETVGKTVLGHVVSKTIDDTGLWIEGQINKASKYAEMVMALVRDGVLGFSTGSVAHLAEIERAGKVYPWTGAPGRISSWPIVEASLTATPYEPRTVGVKDLDEIGDQNPATKSFIDLVKALPSGPSPIDGDGYSAPAGTYEYLQEQLARLTRAALQTDPYCCSWAWVVQTYPDYCVVAVDDVGGPDYYRIAYVVGTDGLPVLGEIEEVQRVYLPIESPPAEMAATAVLSAYVADSATSLAARVRGLHEGRVKEGRVLSPANRERLTKAHDALMGLQTTYATLLTETEPKTSAAVGTTKAVVEVQAAHARILALASGLVEVSL